MKKSRSSHRRCSTKKGVLKNFAKFTGKRLCQSLYFNKVAGLRPSVNFAKFLRTIFLQSLSGRLLLEMNLHYPPFLDRQSEPDENFPK